MSKKEKLRITKIDRQKRNPRRVSLYIDGRFAMGLDFQVAQDMGLRQGMEISQSQLQKVTSAAEKSKAKNFALDFIGYRPRSVWEVAERLKKRGHSQSVIDQVIRELCKSDLLNDLQFAAQWAQSRLTTKPLGELLLRRELKLKGISDEIVEKTVAQIFGQVSQKELAANLLKIRRKRYLPLDEKQAKQRMAAFLLRRGFPRGLVWEIVEQTLYKGKEE